MSDHENRVDILASEINRMICEGRSALAKENGKLKAQRANCEDSLNVALQQVHDHKQTMKNIRLNYQQCESDLLGEVRTAREKTRVMTRNRNSLSGRLTFVESERDKLKRKVDNTDKDFQNQRKYYKTFISEIQEKLRRKNEAVTALTMEVADIRREWDLCVNTNKEQAFLIADLRAGNADLTTVVENLSAELFRQRNGRFPVDNDTFLDLLETAITLADHEGQYTAEESMKMWEFMKAWGWEETPPPPPPLERPADPDGYACMLGQRRQQNKESNRPLNANCPWSDAEFKSAASFFKLGYSCEEIGECFGRSTGAIHTQLSQMGVI